LWLLNHCLRYHVSFPEEVEQNKDDVSYRVIVSYRAILIPVLIDADHEYPMTHQIVWEISHCYAQAVTFSSMEATVFDDPRVVDGDIDVRRRIKAKSPRHLYLSVSVILFPRMISEPEEPNAERKCLEEVRL
jgi:hypothetical protein